MVAGDDLLLQDVISFEVKALYDVPPTTSNPTGLGSDFQLLPVCGSTAGLGSNSVYAAAGARVFDTWSSSGSDSVYPGYSGWGSSTPSAYTIPLKIHVRALQIVIRVWDKKTQQARQITLVQDM
ncbi:MAG TPA: hypothetical protein VFA18_09655, partial [Gemmataceae bacterium]|nr:hypothetical protein [Gemmataceae bacterium]